MKNALRTGQLGLGMLLVLSAQYAISAADPALGARAFQQCAACHSIRRGETLSGPSLANIWGQKAGSNKSFPRYSDALRNSRVVWDEHTLDLWLTDPQRVIPGNSMVFPGIKDGITRGRIVAYLRTVAGGKAPPAGAQPTGVPGRTDRANLKSSRQEAQVISITHCRDTYTVRTLKGPPRKIWEFDLRLKTDSSERGPNPGKPVIMGSGMMGDRASVIFSSPAEISGFIKASCG